MSVRHYCTYFDSNYLAYGLTLHASLQRHARPFVLHVLCMDDVAYDFLSREVLEGVRPIRLADLERFDPALGQVKPSRTRIEYYFTCSPDLMRYVLDSEPGIADVTYLDADLYFFADPKPIFDEIGAGSVGVIAHRFGPDQKRLEAYGVYNVGFLYFRNDAEGRRCLDWWRDRCLEWCFDRLEDGKYADQKYLDEWPSRFRGVVVIETPGAGVAPWNQARYPITLQGGIVHAGGSPLILYHFHGLRFVSGALLKHGATHYGGRMTEALKANVYMPYIRELRSSRRRVNRAIGSERRRGGGVVRGARLIAGERMILMAGPVGVEFGLGRIFKPLARAWRAARTVIRGN